MQCCARRKARNRIHDSNRERERETALTSGYYLVPIRSIQLILEDLGEPGRYLVGRNLEVRVAVEAGGLRLQAFGPELLAWCRPIRRYLSWRQCASCRTAEEEKHLLDRK